MAEDPQDLAAAMKTLSPIQLLYKVRDIAMRDGMSPEDRAVLSEMVVRVRRAEEGKTT